MRKIEYHCKPQFYYKKVGCKGVYITRTCVHDVTRLHRASFWPVELFFRKMTLYNSLNRVVFLVQILNTYVF